MVKYINCIEGKGWKTMFPDSKSEVGVAKAIENVYNGNLHKKVFDKGEWKFSGQDASGLSIEIVVDNNDNVITAYPLFN